MYLGDRHGINQFFLTSLINKTEFKLLLLIAATYLYLSLNLFGMDKLLSFVLLGSHLVFFRAHFWLLAQGIVLAVQSGITLGKVWETICDNGIEPG